MKTENLIENGAEHKSIMAREIKLAGQKRNSKAVYRASVSLTKNLTVRAKARDFMFCIDEPAGFGGAENGPNPEEAVLAAELARRSTARALRRISRNSDNAVRNCPKRVRRPRRVLRCRRERRAGFDRVVCEVVLDSDAPAEKLQEFERLVEERCVGHGTLRQSVAVESHWTINNLRLR